MNELNQKLSDIGIIPVIKMKNPERDAAKLAQALCDGGVPVVEITFRAPDVDKAIRLMKEAMPELIVGAGTVVNTDQIDTAIEAGADFVVSPGFDGELVAYAQEKDIPIYPGCTTPTDYHQALKYGLEMIKFFPAVESGGVAKIHSMSGPFPQFKVMPTGGITLKNLAEFISEPAVAVCGGTYLVTDQLLDDQNWDEITRLCRKSKDIVDAARLGGAVKELPPTPLPAAKPIEEGEYAEKSTDTAKKM